MIDESTLHSKLLIYLKGAYCDFWSINPYKHCDHRCTFCITRAQGVSEPTFGKQETLLRLTEALDYIPENVCLAVGGLVDAYPNSEKQYAITRSILELLCAKNRKFSVPTKGNLVERDMDQLVDNPNAMVVFTFSTLDDDEAREYELGAPPPSSRISVLEKLVASGVRTRVHLKPWIPGVTDIQVFLDRIPHSALPMKLERLKINRASRRFPVGGRVWSQEEIDARYIAEKQRFQCCKELIWQMDSRFSMNHPAAKNLYGFIKNQGDLEQLKLRSRGKLLNKPKTDEVYDR